jgi:hypothetical protein
VSRSRQIALGLVAASLAGAGVWGLGVDAVAQEAVPTSDHTVVIVHVVRNGRAAPGRVTIRDDDGHETSCDVNESGECEMLGIGPGRHVVEATGPDGSASGARAVMIPEDGKVSLIVQLPAPNAD